MAKGRVFIDGYAIRRAGGRLAPYRFSHRAMGVRDVLIDILYCGVCHSDIHEGRNEYGDAMYPMVPGHEIVGRVRAVGSGVSRFRAGDIAGVGPYIACDRTCDRCKRGLESYCDKVVWTYNDSLKNGTRTFGGYSSGIVVNEAFAFTIDPTVPLARVAPLLCAGITTYSPLRHWNVNKGTRLGVLGLGGLGHLAVKFASSMGAEVTVLSSSKAKASDARRLGARRFALTSDIAQLRSLESGFDLILNTSSLTPDLNTFLPLLRVDGTFVQIGEPAESPELPLDLVEYRRHVVGSAVGGLREIQEMLDYCAAKKVFADVEIIPASKVNDAWAAVLKRRARYRFVLDLQSRLS